jgi:tRNA A-37 threonylcarbamoyl transferase component Bud32
MPSLTEEDLRVIQTHTNIIENMIKTHMRTVFDQYGAQTTLNVFLNAGITTIAGGLSAIEDESERLGATINVFIAVVRALKLEMAENAAESIIKKAMQK